MRLWKKLRARLGRDVEGSLSEEMRVHREMLEERFRAEGLDVAAARSRAAREFGPMLEALENSRAEWSFAWFESLWMDARYAVRALGRSKAFTATAVLTLGVGLALAAVAFTLFNTYVLRPFAVADPDSLYQVGWTGKDRSVNFHSWRVYEEIRARHDVVTAALASRDVYATSVDRYWSGKAVSGNYFQMLGARMALGRPIEEQNAAAPLGDQVIVIGHGVWESVFGADTAVLGKKVVLRGRAYEVIGVAAREFGGLDEAPPDFWAPVTMLSALAPESSLVEVVARLREGVTKEQAQAALAALAPDDDGSIMRAELRSRATAITLAPVAILVFAPVVLALALVLATCCANVSNMLLARGLARQREIGIRLSVGAGRGRLVRQLLTEALVIAILSGLFGLLIARAMLQGAVAVLFATAGPELLKGIRMHSLDPDYRVFLFAFVVSATAALGSALLPAIQATRHDLLGALRGEFGARIRASRVRDALVVLQVAICAVLLVFGALLYRRADVFQARDTGINHEGVLHISTGDPALGAELRARADVDSVAIARRAPWAGRLDRTLVQVPGQAAPVIAAYNRVLPDYFRVLGIPLRRGRGFTEDEARHEEAVIAVSQATAAAFWPGENAIGKTIRAAEVGDRHMSALPLRGDLRVIGVVEDVIHDGIFDGRDRTCIYLPAAGEGQSGVTLVRFRAAGSAAPQRVLPWILERQPMFGGQLMPMSEMLRMQVYPFRAAGWIGWMLGLVAMALSLSGMYGVMSYLVSQRLKEIGIRMALGASPGSVAATIMQRSVWLSGLGALIGGALAGGTVRLLLAWSPELGLLAPDNLALALGAGLAAVTAAAAAAGPTRRAAKLDPNAVLRAD